MEFQNKEIKKLTDANTNLMDENGKLELKNQELINLIAMKDSKISHIEKLVDCYSSELESYPNIQNLMKQLDSTLKICDELRIDNFQLKNKLADE